MNLISDIDLYLHIQDKTKNEDIIENQRKADSYCRCMKGIDAIEEGGLIHS